MSNAAANTAARIITNALRATMRKHLSAVVAANAADDIACVAAMRALADECAGWLVSRQGFSAEDAKAATLAVLADVARVDFGHTLPAR